MAKKRFTKLYASAKKMNIIKKLDDSFIIRLLAPAKGSNNYNNIERYLKRSDFKKSVERYYSYKFILMVLTLLLLIILNSYLIGQSVKNIIYGNKYSKNIMVFTGIDNNIANIKSDPKQLLLIKTAESTNYKKLIRKGQLQQLANTVKQLEKNNNINDEDNQIAKDVLADLVRASELKTSFSAILLIFSITIFSGKIIDYYLHIKGLLRDSTIEKEIEKLEYHAVILIKGSKMPVEDILIRLRNYSDYLKPYFNKCLAEYPVERLSAIDNLITDVDNPNFTKFISLIQQNLITDRDTNIRLLETQKDINNVLAEEKRRGKTLKTARIYSELTVPIYVLAAFILILPLLKYINGLF